MNETLLLYAFTRLDMFITVSFIITILSACLILIISVILAVDQNRPERTKKYLWVPIVFLILFVTIPSKKDAMFIVAGTKVIEIARDPDVQRVAGKSAKLIEQYIDNMLEDKK